MASTVHAPVPAAQLQVVLHAALDAARVVSGARLCGFAWHEADDEPRLIVSGVGDEAVAHQAIEAFAEAGTAAELPVGMHVEPVETTDGLPLGLLVAQLWSTVDDHHLPDAAAPLAGVALHLGALMTAYLRHAPPTEAYRALFEIGTQIQAEESHPGGVLNLIVDKARQLIGTDMAWLALVDEDGYWLRMAVAKGTQAPGFLEIKVAMGEGMGGIALAHGEPILVRDYRSDLHETPPQVRETMVEEGIVSVICVPMLREGRMVGALYVANRRRTDFAHSDTALLCALAAQASVAIDNARLYRMLAHQNELLEQSFIVHRKLTDAGLRDAGLGGVAQTLATVLQRPIVVEQGIVLPFRERYTAGAAVTAADEEASVELPIVAGAIKLGSLSVPGTAELSELQRKALEQGATVLALELVKLRAARDVEWRVQGELLEELLETSGELPEALMLRSQRLGVTVDQRHRVMVMQLADDHPVEYGRLLAAVRAVVAREAVGRGGGEALAAKRGPRVVLALAERMDDRYLSVIEGVQQAARDLGGALAVGVSALQGDFSAALREAQACLRLARSAKNAEAVISYEDLGPLRFLLDAPDLEHAMTLVQERLGPFLEHDRTRRTPLLPTLRAYVEADGHQATVAERCFIHVSTVKYRLARIRELLDAPLTDPETRFDLRLAFRILDLLEALGSAPAQLLRPAGDKVV